MTATQPGAPTAAAGTIQPGAPGAATRTIHPDRAEGIELLGPVQGSGYRSGVGLVRRADGQIIQLGRLMYTLLDCLDGQKDLPELTGAFSAQLGRSAAPHQVERLIDKLAAQGLVAGSEHQAPPRRHPLLALRWKYLVTDPKVTARVTRPFAFLFHPWIMWPVLAAFAAVCWFVLVDKGVASATAQAFHDPGLLLLVTVLAIVSAGFHELGHAAACRYAGATPGGMGVGLYLVWPAFYTDVTDAYRLPRRDRLRIDLAGLYFNAVVAVLTMVVWLFCRTDALLLLVALQILQMVKQLSPIIRADGYHILSDATGVPDLFAHIGPTLRRLVPGAPREESALTGRARLLVTVWVLVVVPVLLSLMLGAVLLLPHLLTSAWDNGRRIAGAIPHEVADAQVLRLLAALIELVALVLPVGASVLVTQKFVRSSAAKALRWSSGRPGRRALVIAAAAGIVALLAWAWWPSGQYRPVRADQRGTLPSLVRTVVGPSQAAFSVAPGAHLALAMIPEGGPTPTHPAVYVIPGARGRPPTELVSFGPNSLEAFPFALPGRPGPHGTQALAVNTEDGSVKYTVAYSIITVRGGAPVDETNSAFAIARCKQCTTVAASFQLVLVIGQSASVAPIDAAGALNYDCPACTTTAIADQMVVTLTAQPSQALMDQLEAALQQLNSLYLLGRNGTPAAVATQIQAVQNEIATLLVQSGLLAPTSVSTSTSTSTTTSTTVAGSGSLGTAQATTTTLGSDSTTVPATSSDATTTTIDSSTAPTAASTTTATTAPPTTAPASSSTSAP